MGWQGPVEGISLLVPASALTTDGMKSVGIQSILHNKTRICLRLYQITY